MRGVSSRAVGFLGDPKETQPFLSLRPRSITMAVSAGNDRRIQWSRRGKCLNSHLDGMG